MKYEEITIEDIIAVAETYTDVHKFKKENLRMYIKACKLKLIRDLFDPRVNQLNKPGLYFYMIMMS